MKRTIYLLLLLALTTTAMAQSLWIESADRYKKPTQVDLSTVDSVVFRNSQMRIFTDGAARTLTYTSALGMDSKAEKSVAMGFGQPNMRIIWKPTTSTTTTTPIPTRSGASHAPRRVSISSSIGIKPSATIPMLRLFRQLCASTSTIFSRKPSSSTTRM